MKLILTPEPTTGGEEAIIRRQPATPVADKAHQHLTTIVVGALCIEVVHKLRNRGPLIVCVELEINIIN